MEYNHTPLELDGQTFRLIYDFETLCRVEEATGMNLLFSVDWNRVEARRMRALLWALLLKEHPDVNLDDLTKYITFEYAGKIQHALFMALLKAETKNAEAEPEVAEPQEVAA